MATSRRNTRLYHVGNDKIQEILFADHSDEEEDHCLDQEDQDFLEGDADAVGEEIYIEPPSKKATNLNDTTNNTLSPASHIVENPEFRWKRTCPPIPKVNTKQPLVTSFDNCEVPPTALDIFKTVTGLDSLINDILIPQSQLYMEQKGIPFTSCYEEICTFLGLSYRMAYHVMPRIRDYWSKESDLHVACVANHMAGRRYEEVRSALHFSDNATTLDKDHPMYDRACKIRPLLNHLNYHFQQALQPTQTQSIDEHMIKFKGRNVMRQYVKSKPIKWGFKFWCRCDAKSGYLFEADIYTGKKQYPELGLGETVVLQLTKSLENLGIEIFIDNFFNSPLLQYALKTKGINCCGTVRPNRKHMPKNMKDEKMMKRGDSDRMYADGVSCVKWKDNKSVMLLSNYLSPMATSEVSRRQKTAEGFQRIKISQPEMIKTYNMNMSGVDLMGQKKVTYEIDRKSKVKFYLRIFFDLMDIAMNNAEFIYQTVMKTNFPNEDRIKDSFDFRRAVATALIGDNTCRQRRVPIQHPSRLQTFIPAPMSPSHQLIKREERRRCVVCTQRKRDIKTNNFCSRCQVFLCFTNNRNCFAEYHS